MKKIPCLLLVVVLLFSTLSAAGEEAGILVKEEDGGEFRPLPIDLSEGSSLPYTFQYNTEYKYYEDPTIRVERYEITESEWSAIYWYALITIRDPSQLRTASVSENNPFLDSLVNYGRVLAKNKRAVLAINGDYCSTFWTDKSQNFILRQGTVYRDSAMPDLDILLIDEEGDFHILSSGENDLTAVDKTQIDGKKVINALQFGPALVINGEKVPDEIILDPSHSPQFAEPESRTQRMCICQIDKLHYMTVCCAYFGMDLPTFRDLILSLAPVKTAYVLDGGESAQMFFLGRQCNAGANGNKDPRMLTDIVYFASAWFLE